VNNQVNNPKEKIYFLLYAKPRNVSEIANILYGKRNTKVSTWITEMIINGWVSEYKPKKKQRLDRRMKYYYANPKGLLDYFEADLKKKNIHPLSKKQKHILLEYLDSDKFRSKINLLSNDEIKNAEHIFYDIKNQFAFELIYKNHIHTINQQIAEELPIKAPTKHEILNDDELFEKLSYLSDNKKNTMRIMESFEDVNSLLLDEIIDLRKENKKLKEGIHSVNGNGHGLN
jgi:hypothetical protein